MSSSYVRNKIKTTASFINSGSLDYPNAFYDTVNNEVKPQDRFWYTARFNLEDTQRGTHDDHYIETGLIDLIFTCPGGKGDGIIEICEKISREIYKVINKDGDQLSITKLMAPEEFAVKAAMGFEIVIGLEYLYYYTVS